MRTHRLVAGLVTGLVGTALFDRRPRCRRRHGRVDYTINVDATGTGPAIDPAMYGVFFEDINRAADGGLYAELVQNRSFEYLPVDNGSYTGLTSWSAVSSSGGSGSIATVDDDARLNERNRTYLKVALTNAGAGTYGVLNSGYNTGIAIEAGKTYDFSVWARSDAAGGTPLTVALRDQAGTTTYAAPVRLAVQGDTWRRYTGTFVATGATDAARLAVQAAGTGTPAPRHGLALPPRHLQGPPQRPAQGPRREDRRPAPGFLRFPGGCIVNTGSMYGYDAASGYQRDRAYQWKDTIGPVEERATNPTSGATTSPTASATTNTSSSPRMSAPSRCPSCRRSSPAAGRTGPSTTKRCCSGTSRTPSTSSSSPTARSTSTWGAERAAMGHPAPFGLDRTRGRQRGEPARRLHGPLREVP